MRERSERKTSVFNQKTMFLGYAHSSVNNQCVTVYALFFASLKNLSGRACFKLRLFDNFSGSKGTPQ
ncbi:MAG: hypothetical protein U5L45_21725 [Saprospiraceae bacterium]|nr:hypothetical protein [Saprospiraceae bacterium]